MSRPDLRVTVACLLAIAIGGTAEARAQVPVSEQAAEVRLSGDLISMPIVVIRSISFVENSIADVRGKLMLDTGIEAEVDDCVDLGRPAAA